MRVIVNYITIILLRYNNNNNNYMQHKSKDEKSKLFMKFVNFFFFGFWDRILGPKKESVIFIICIKIFNIPSMILQYFH